MVRFAMLASLALLLGFAAESQAGGRIFGRFRRDNDVVIVNNAVPSAVVVNQQRGFFAPRRSDVTIINNNAGFVPGATFVPGYGRSFNSFQSFRSFDSGRFYNRQPELIFIPGIGWQFR